MQKRVFSVTLALFFLFTIVFSASFLGVQADHKHLGESDCAICRQMQDCSERLHTPAACPNPKKTSQIFARTRKTDFQRRSSLTRSCVNSPVSLKDKLTD